MKGAVAVRQSRCQDQSLAWSQSSPPPWEGKLDWTRSLRGPCRGQAHIPKYHPAWHYHQESEDTRQVPSLRAGLAGPGWNKSIPKQARGVFPPIPRGHVTMLGYQNSHDWAKTKAEKESSLSGQGKASDKALREEVGRRVTRKSLWAGQVESQGESGSR